MRALVGLAVLAMAAVSGCGGDDGGGDDAIAFPADYEASYVEVRDCRPNGGSHDFNQIRVLADPAALEPYQQRAAPFPVDAVVLKEEYQAGDADCSGPIRQWSVMQRLPDGNDEQLNWRWQQVDANRVLVGEDQPRCIGCHAGCAPPDGYEGTCTVP